MRLARAFAVAAGLLLPGAGPVLAAEQVQVYVYAVMHPSYGRIGTRTDTVDRSADTMRVDSRLRVEVPPGSTLPQIAGAIARQGSDRLAVITTGTLL